MKKDQYIILFLLISAIILTAYYNLMNPESNINSYEECVNAGYPIMESYPEQCMKGDGTTYTRELGEFCGTQTNGECSSNSDCVKSGCSEEICQSINEEPRLSDCEYKECYNYQVRNLDCTCQLGKCSWNSIN